MTWMVPEIFSTFNVVLKLYFFSIEYLNFQKFTQCCSFIKCVTTLHEFTGHVTATSGLLGQTNGMDSHIVFLIEQFSFFSVWAKITRGRVEAKREPCGH